MIGKTLLTTDLAAKKLLICVDCIVFHFEFNRPRMILDSYAYNVNCNKMKANCVRI